MSINAKILKKYELCHDKNCINKDTIFIKKVFSDMQYIPLCSDCIRKHRNAIVRFSKSSIALDDKEISYIYFTSLNLL